VDLKDSVAVVTGASSGIGKATAWQLASRGANLVVAARREDRLKKLAENIAAQDGRALPGCGRRDLARGSGTAS
jgi:NADP-dependent 3-hydroxy acid dehydrogenase YdfG